MFLLGCTRATKAGKVKNASLLKVKESNYNGGGKEEKGSHQEGVASISVFYLNHDR